MPTDLPPDWVPHEERQRASVDAASMRAVLSASNWLYWMAGITAVNAVLPLLGTKTTLSLGLGITRLVDYFVKMPAVSLAAAALGAAFLAALGILGRRAWWAFAVALVLIAVDSGLLYALGALKVYAILFRAWVFGAVINGMLSLRRLQEANSSYGEAV
ncbi:MAG: hypothetical protein ACO1SV_04750 [Fimbriimonas sp.]